jgi:magnesium transporter
VETMSSIYLGDAHEKLVGSVPLVSLVLASGGTRLGAITPDHVIFVEANASDKDVAEMFDKYNLLTLPVVDEEQRLAGIITADDIISLLRDRI